MIGLNPVKSLGQRVYEIAIAALLLTAVVMFAYGQFKSWRAGTWKERAEASAAAASTAQGNADSANAGAANASRTRSNIDAGTVTVRLETEASARRIEAHESHDPAATGVPDDSVMRELVEAETRARAAADRLQRTRAR